MLGHYLTVALRTLMRHKLHTAVSLAVLALGLSSFVAVYLFVSYLRGYDRQFANADRMFVVFQGLHSPKYGLEWPSYPASSVPLAPQLALDVPSLEAVARYRPMGRTFVNVDGEQRPRRAAYAEPPFLRIFNFKVVAGDLRDALSGSNAIVTEATAESLFGTRDVVGKTVSITERNTADITIAAVITDLPAASHLNPRGLWTQGFDILLPWDMAEKLSPLPAGAGWYNTMVYTYGLLPKDGSLSLADVDRRLERLIADHIPKQGITVTLDARPVSSIATGLMQSQFQGFQGTAWRVDIFTALEMLGAAILVIACVNFVNLATARAATRTREVVIRKALGAAAGQVIRQELLQTAVLVLLALVLAIGVFAALRGLVRDPWRLALVIPVSEPRFWAFLGVLVCVVTLLAGVYPAFALARVRPATALHTSSARAGSRWLRTWLVGSQFAVATFLLIAVVVLLAQRGTLHERLLGRLADQYVYVLPDAPGGETIDRGVLRTELLKGPGVKGVTATGSFPWQFAGGRPRLTRTVGEGQSAPEIERVFVSYDYFAVMDVPLLAGRTFARDRHDETPTTPDEVKSRDGPVSVILDRQLAEALGWTNPADAIGQLVYYDGQASRAREVIGVAESEPLALRERGSAGMAYVLSSKFSASTVIRIAKENAARSVAFIDDVFKKLSPTHVPRTHVFLDQAFENAYFLFALMNRVFITLALVAIGISGIGLFGMASFMTSRRTREIGLRKSQGASSMQILRLLLWDFAKPVLIANLVAWPVAFVAAERYLDLFAERMTLTPAPFVLALAATLAIACVAVGARVIRAAGLPPTAALREE